MFNIHLLTFLTTDETGNMRSKLAVFDIDGTLAEIQQPTKLEASKKLRDSEKLGAKIVLTSGKNVFLPLAS
jgi:hydroxymethylpyrimidine pyrophosphatase-like HAD family hydrolase